ncbi:TPA_asm: P6 [Peat soil associated betacytorhabdovirus 1]|nr:TPA_asm: P6 [Peat soil associated betacytorhabdovirus 1]
MDNYHTNISQGEIAIILILSHAIVLLSWGLWRIKYFLLRKVIQAVERGDVHVYHHK